MGRQAYYHGASWHFQSEQMKTVTRLLCSEFGVTFIEVDVDVQQPLLPAISGIPTVVIYDTDVSGSEPVSILQPAMVTPANLRKVLR